MRLHVKSHGRTHVRTRPPRDECEGVSARVDVYVRMGVCNHAYTHAASTHARIERLAVPFGRSARSYPAACSKGCHAAFCERFKASKPVGSHHNGRHRQR
jgi:hypothetical protein